MSIRELNNKGPRTALTRAFSTQPAGADLLTLALRSAHGGAGGPIMARRTADLIALLVDDLGGITGTVSANSDPGVAIRPLAIDLARVFSSLCTDGAQCQGGDDHELAHLVSSTPVLRTVIQ